MPIDLSKIQTYKLVAQNRLKPYESLLASALFDLKTVQSETASFTVQSGGMYYSRPRAFQNPQQTPQEKDKAVAIVTDYLFARYDHLQTMVDQKRVPGWFRGLLMPMYMKLTDCLPHYDESSGKQVRYWELRYELELPFNGREKAKWQEQRLVFYCSNSIIGMDYQSRILDDRTSLPLLRPAPLQALNESDTVETLPLRYLTQGERALPFWMAENGTLVPATKEGEVNLLTTNTAPNYTVYIYGLSGRFLLEVDEQPFWAIVVIREDGDAWRAIQYNKNAVIAALKQSKITAFMPLVYFYFSENTMSTARDLAVGQDAKAKYILDHGKGTDKDRIERIIYGDKNQKPIVEMTMILYVTSGNNEAKIFDFTEEVVKTSDNVSSVSVEMSPDLEERALRTVLSIGGIPVAHAHTHGRFYSYLAVKYSVVYSVYELDILKADVKSENELTIANPSKEDQNGVKCFDNTVLEEIDFNIPSIRRVSGDNVRIQFIFTVDGVCVYSSNKEINSGDFFGHDNKKRRTI